MGDRYIWRSVNMGDRDVLRSTSCNITITTSDNCDNKSDN